jgi:cytosine/uracil/thiamine/allantoin permease
LTLAAVTYAALLIWSVERSKPLLLAQASPADRTATYSQFASSAVALLAVTLTVLAILLALPDRVTLEELRASPTWPRLQGTLLATALLCLIALVSAQLGAAIDDEQKGKQWLDLLTITSASMAIIAVLLGGIVFALFLRAVQQPVDPSKGRGL